MEFISKADSKKAFIKLLDAFMNAQWDSVTHRYINLTYEDFVLGTDPKPRRLLLKGQQCRCCYCMRDIVAEEDNEFAHLTVEHVIPRNSVNDPNNSDELAKELDFYEKSSRYLKRTRVVYVPKSVRRNITTKFNTPPYPHLIAYHNLVCSCKGEFHEFNTDGTIAVVPDISCNEARENEMIFPVFFNAALCKSVKYQIDGTYVCSSKKYQASILAMMDTAKLNIPRLTEIRQIWAGFVLEGVSEQEILTADNEQKRKDLIDFMDLPKSDRDKYKHQEFWDDLILFKWFYQYYDRNIPAGMRH